MPIRKARKRAWLVALVLAVSALWWADGYSDPDSSFTPVPAGDVSYGFRSNCGSLQWVQNASWHHPQYYVQWSIPWWSVIAIEIAALIVTVKGLRLARHSADDRILQP